MVEDIHLEPYVMKPTAALCKAVVALHLPSDAGFAANIA